MVLVVIKAKLDSGCCFAGWFRLLRCSGINKSVFCRLFSWLHERGSECCCLFPSSKRARFPVLCGSRTVRRRFPGQKGVCSDPDLLGAGFLLEPWTSKQLWALLTNLDLLASDSTREGQRPAPSLPSVLSFANRKLSFQSPAEEFGIGHLIHGHFQGSGNHTLPWAHSTFTSLRARCLTDACAAITFHHHLAAGSHFRNSLLRFQTWPFSLPLFSPSFLK